MSSSFPDTEASIPTTECTNDVPQPRSFYSCTKQMHTDVDSGSPDTASNHASTRETLLERWKGNERRSKGMGGREQALQLLDLPIDILNEIIKEITHTNHLKSLALTCSALHGLTIPWIYSRFDIVWPDAHSNADSRQGVDALTYGLATLVMGDEPCSTMQQAEYRFSYFCTHCGMLNDIPTSPESPAKINRKGRRGNLYPHYTRHFSLGNGPDEWINEYLINRESGKMLGTLVALALARMPQLQTFIWDMPTGVLRDCWLALSSLGEGRGIREPNLEKVWVRLHDNREILDAPVASPTASQGNPPGPCLTRSTSYILMDQPPRPLEWSYMNTESPNFSELPPLKSLNVLNIDEIAYLQEMSVLIQRSLIRLRELRIGLASIVPKDGFASSRDLDVPVDDDEPTEYQQVLHRLLRKLLTIDNPRCQTLSDAHAVSTTVAKTPVKEKPILGSNNVMTNSCLAASPNIVVAKNSVDNPTASPGDASTSEALTASDPAGILGSLEMRSNHEPTSGHWDVDGIVTSTSSLSITPSGEDLPHTRGTIAWSVPAEWSSSNRAMKQNHAKVSLDTSKTPISLGEGVPGRGKHRKRLRLEVLELEYIDVDAAILLRTINLSVLTTLTLLNCDSQDILWRALRDVFTPRPSRSQPVLRRKSKMHLSDMSSVDPCAVSPSEYRLNLRRIHTNCVSSTLIGFLKETLAPNSLEWLFLQDGGKVTSASGGRATYDSSVSAEAIYRGPLRRHRLSLKKLMIDSDDRPLDNRRRTSKWRKWKLDRDVLSFLTSGKMTALREVAMSIDYHDWHFLLHRLPQVPHVRSLYIQQVADHPYGHHLNAKELALQVMDIASLRPEMELCYLAIANKCFEILEGTHVDDIRIPVNRSSAAPANPGPDDTNSSDEDSNDDDEDDDDNDDEDGDGDGDGDGDDEQTANGEPTGEDNDLGSQPESLEYSDDELAGWDGHAKAPRLKLREILFYDDKISIFKARHGKL